MLSRIRSTFVATALVVGASIMPVASAGAAPAVSQPDFRQQARAAGLTQAQASYLQQQSDYYLAAMGGKRVSLNQIDVNGTATVSIALPGESHPRDFAAKSGARLPGPPCVEGSGAPYLYFCAYKYQYLTGDSIAMYHCVSYSIPWVSEGSWDNNQTPGTSPMMFYSNSGSERLPGAYSYQFTGVFWRYITAIRPCD
jgi:hypothetical protein